jgi:hypothetical protein
MQSAYKDTVLSELARHGVCPRLDTPPELIREFINDLYVYEIRRLKAGMLSGGFPKNEYAARVEQLRNRYPILALPIRYWRETD